MRPLEYGKLKKLGPGHYRVVWPKKRKRKTPEERRKGGRPPAAEYPELEQDQPAEESTPDGQEGIEGPKSSPPASPPQGA